MWASTLLNGNVQWRSHQEGQHKLQRPHQSWNHIFCVPNVQSTYRNTFVTPHTYLSIVFQFFIIFLLPVFWPLTTSAYFVLFSYQNVQLSRTFQPYLLAYFLKKFNIFLTIVYWKILNSSSNPAHFKLLLLARTLSYRHHSNFKPDRRLWTIFRLFTCFAVFCRFWDTAVLVWCFFCPSSDFIMGVYCGILSSLEWVMSSVEWRELLKIFINTTIKWLYLLQNSLKYTFYTSDSRKNCFLLSLSRSLPPSLSGTKPTGPSGEDLAIRVMWA